MAVLIKIIEGSTRIEYDSGVFDDADMLLKMLNILQGFMHWARYTVPGKYMMILFRYMA
jgi:hypothetical protein